MPSYVQILNESDLQRIIDREFVPELRKEVGELLDRAAAKWPDGKHRVSIAMIKLANGDLAELERQIQIASVDTRDVLAAAEYPRFWKIGFVGFKKLSPEGRAQLRSDDWGDYQKWLLKE